MPGKAQAYKFLLEQTPQPPIVVGLGPILLATETTLNCGIVLCLVVDTEGLVALLNVIIDSQV